MRQTVSGVRLLGNSRGQPTNTVIGLAGPRSRLRQGGTMRCWRALPIELALLSTRAAVAYLRGRADIRADQIGLWGHSQGSGVVPLAGSLSDHVAFVIAVGGWQGPAWKQDLMRVETELRANRFPDEDIKEAVAFAK